MDNSTQVSPKTSALSSDGGSTPVRGSLIWIRVGAWIVAVALGAAQAWAARFTMNPDGISYLDIGDAYWRHDWHNAVNAYWSPLYSWILGLFINVIKPTPYWEYPLVHLVNFLIYVAALGCFEFFLNTLLRAREVRRDGAPDRERTGVPKWFWWLFGYSLFLISSLVLVGMSIVTPDMLVTACIYLASALTIKIWVFPDQNRSYVALGIILCLGYLAKAVMFPLAFVFLAVVLLSEPPFSRSVRKTLISLLVFLTLALPFITALSLREKRVTFGESARWTYRFYVNGVGYWPADFPAFVHPVRTLSSSLSAYEFGEPIAGTFPPWYDPTYWTEGAKPKPTIKGELQPATLAIVLYAVALLPFLHVLIGACVLYSMSPQPKWRDTLTKTWVLGITPAASLLLYSMVHVETRFIAAQFVLLLLVLYSGINLPPRYASRTAATVTFRSIVGISTILVAVVVWQQNRAPRAPIFPEAAEALQKAGLLKGDRIGLLWDEKWNAGAAEGAFVPRLLRLRIVAEATNATEFWKVDQESRQRTLDALRHTRIRGVLSYGVPEPAQSGWIRLGTTDFYAYIFQN